MKPGLSCAFWRYLLRSAILICLGSVCVAVACRAGVFARSDSACLTECVCPRLRPAYSRLLARFARCAESSRSSKPTVCQFGVEPITFCVGGDDAESRQRKFTTILPTSNRQDLSDYKTFIRTMRAEPGRAGEPQGPMRVKTFPAFARQGTENDKHRVIQASLRRYSRPQSQVHTKINKSLSP